MFNTTDAYPPHLLVLVGALHEPFCHCILSGIIRSTSVQINNRKSSGFWAGLWLLVDALIVQQVAKLQVQVVERANFGCPQFGMLVCQLRLLLEFLHLLDH